MIQHFVCVCGNHLKKEVKKKLDFLICECGEKAEPGFPLPNFRFSGGGWTRGIYQEATPEIKKEHVNNIIKKDLQG